MIYPAIFFLLYTIEYMDIDTRSKTFYSSKTVLKNICDKMIRFYTILIYNKGLHELSVYLQYMYLHVTYVFAGDHN